VDTLVWILSALEVVLLATAVVWIWIFRRVDLTWLELIAAGPMILLRPSRYLQHGRAAVLKTLLALWLTLFVAMWALR
jgi:hypothetical protein